jgi:hypothetical protein
MTSDYPEFHAFTKAIFLDVARAGADVHAKAFVSAHAL